MSAEQEPVVDPQSLFDLATRVVEHTNRHLFLTGKAGTGKTTFLKHITNNTRKKVVVAAPTGVAAMNAGGMTLHSLFGLPMGAYLADARFDEIDGSGLIVNRQTLFQNMRLTSERRSLLQAIELLIIDEVSMLRADILDAIDAILRQVRRRRHEPFGGVQVLLIGDLYQLPPIVTQDEARLYAQYYKSAFFFHSNVMEAVKPLVIELNKVYRQQDQRFVDLLNAVRNNEMGPREHELLRSRYQPGTEAAEGVILLTTHNYRADYENTRRLDALPGSAQSFDGAVTGTFNEKALPVDQKLWLKVGAQIMFIKNDIGDSRRYYNGLICKVTHIGEEGDIWVQPPAENSVPLKLEAHTWKNIRYKFNVAKESIEEEVLGSYSQLPIRLAWAITIHKSQGLSFDRAIVDAGQAFTSGQVYVALSRLRSLEGLILHTQISPNGFDIPTEILDFYRRQLPDSELRRVIEGAQYEALLLRLQRWFSFENLLQNWEEQEEKWINKPDQKRKSAANWLREKRLLLFELDSTGQKFQKELNVLFNGALSQLAVRVSAAEVWFRKEFHRQIVAPYVAEHNQFKLQNATAKFIQEWESLEAGIQECIRGWKVASAYTAQLAQGKTMNEIQVDIPVEALIKKTPKGVKVDTYQVSLDMFNKGMSPAEIALARGMSPSTIDGHMLHFIENGKLKPADFFSAEQIASVQSEWEKQGLETSATPIQQTLGDDYSFFMIRSVKAYMKRLAEA